jgi:hypothetical protein
LMKMIAKYKEDFEVSFLVFWYICSDFEFHFWNCNFRLWNVTFR